MRYTSPARYGKPRLSMSRNFTHGEDTRWLNARFVIGNLELLKVGIGVRYATVYFTTAAGKTESAISAFIKWGRNRVVV